MNTVTIVGRIGNDLELKQVGDSQVVNFRLAEDYRKGKEKITNWHSCVLWGKSAEVFTDNLKKGDVVGVTGELQQRKDPKDDKRVYTDVRCASFYFIPGANKREEESEF